MSQPSISPFKGRSPRPIPVYLDTTDEHSRILNVCGPTSTNQPTPYSTILLPGPPPYRTGVSPSPSPSYQSKPLPTTPSEHLAVPPPNPDPSRHHRSRPQPPRPALRFDFISDAEGRLRVRSSRLGFSPLSPGTIARDIYSGRRGYTSGSSIPNTPVDGNECPKSKLGLGIPQTSFPSDSSPISSPGAEKLAEAEGESPSQKKKRKRRVFPNVAQGIEEKLWKFSTSKSILKRWLIEILSLTLSAVCMGALVIVLLVLRNSPLPKSWPLNITLNAYIAILSRIASAALLFPASEAIGQLKWSWFQQRDSKKLWDFELFDNASRGPWGSFLLLFRTKGRSWAILGAAITIFAVALDPFFQQIVHYPQRWAIQPYNSSVPRIVRYEPGWPREFDNEGQELYVYNMDISAAIQKHFVDDGIPQVQVGNGTRAEVPVICPGSHCTWEPYQTLAICSKCADVSYMLDYTCRKGPLDWVSTATSYIPYDNGTMCGWFFNATGVKPLLMSGYQADDITKNLTGEVLMTRTLPLITNINRRQLFGGSISFQQYRNRITDFVVATVPDAPDRGKMLDHIFRQEKPRTTECMLTWCVQTIQSSYYTGTYTETVTDRVFNETAPLNSYPWFQVDAGIPDPDNPGENLVFHLYTENITIDTQAINGQGGPSSYGLTNETMVDILTAFDGYLPNFWTTGLNHPEFQRGMGANSTDTLLKRATNDKRPKFRRNAKNPMATQQNLTLYMSRLADTMTNGLRLYSTDMVEGKSYGEETYIEVRWEWLVLPVGLLVLAFIFLVATMIHTSTEMNAMGVWKNSAIATLLYGLPDEIQRRIASSPGSGTPRMKAEELNVRLLPTKTWRISGDSPTLIASKSKYKSLRSWI